MRLRARPLRLYGATSECAPLEWSWVQDQLARAGTYWVVAPASGSAHARPVWGVWDGHGLHLSVGSPALSRAIGRRQAVTVHLESGTDVVIVEGSAAPGGPGTTPRSVLQLYNDKYDWDYQVVEHGELTVVEPVKVMAWQSAGWAGRDGFRATGCWVFGPD